MKKIDFELVQAGDLLPPLIKPAITRTQIAQFSAAVHDFAPMHVDEAQAKAKGYDGVCAHPQLAFAYLEQLLHQYATNLKILKFSSTFHKLIWPGDALTCKGIVTKCSNENGKQQIELDLWAENQNQNLVLKGRSTCVLL